VLRFRGLPFAQPPVGSLRFRPPQPEEPWAGVREACEAAAAAPQLAAVTPLVDLVGGGPRSSEDSLALNVWTPSLEGRRPVMVWIHGGAFVMGAGSSPMYSGRALVQRGNVVVVTLNYRLGALGFLPLASLRPDLDFATNLGLRDQLAALAWVRDNIAAFGGDPGNVTIFGESAGAMSVGTLLGCPGAAGLFHKAIAQSGAAHNCSSPARAAQVAQTFLEELGIPVEAAERLRNVGVPALLAAQARASMRLGVAHGTLPWQPWVDGDLLPEPPLRAVAAGLSRGVPLFIGTNRDEWKLFLLTDRKARRMDAATLRRRLGYVLPGCDAAGRAYADDAFEAYRDAGRTPVERWSAFQTDRIFVHPAACLAAAQRAHQPATFRYRFDWAPLFVGGWVGACHGIELPLVFGSWRRPLLRPIFFGGDPRRLARTLQEAWTHFASTGRPEAWSTGSFPALEAERTTLMVLGSHCHRATVAGNARDHFWSRVEGDVLSDFRCERRSRQAPRQLTSEIGKNVPR